MEGVDARDKRGHDEARNRTEPARGGRRLSRMPRRKLIEFHPETLTSLEELATDRMATMQELADEAFADLLRKHGRPVGLRQSLKKSAKAIESKSSHREEISGRFRAESRQTRTRKKYLCREH